MNSQIDQLVEQARAFPEPQTRETALELAQAILDLHGDALGRLVDLLSQSSGGRPLLEQLASDPKIGAILLLHDLHPLDLSARVERALADPALHRGNTAVHLISIEDGVVRARAEGSPELRSALEQAIWDAAPDASEVIVDGARDFAPSGFVPLEQLLAGSA